ncbi:MAG: hypothetical protein IK032_01720, partial [Bacteroidales bacterium]|nr:hypothetical protein [Bacteroidales bacterium]
MKKTFKIAALAAVAALVVVSCGPKSEIDGFEKTEKGLHYKFLTENKSGEQVKIGDVLVGEVVMYLDEEPLDSVVGEP